MVTKVIIDYLDDDSKTPEDKIKLVNNCELSYSDIFALMDRYKDTNLYPALHSLVYFYDTKLQKSLLKEKHEAKIKNQSKRLRHIKKRGL